MEERQESHPELFNITELAEFLRLSPNTIRDWVRKRYGPPFIKLGDSHRSPVRFSRREVIAWLKGRRNEQTAQTETSTA